MLWVLAGLLTLIGIGLVWLGFSDGGCGYIIFGIILALLGILLFIGLFSDYVPTAEEIAQAQENYIDAYENTVILEDYTDAAKRMLRRFLSYMH